MLLSPGLLLTIPPGKGGVWMSGKTCVAAVLVHAVIFAVASYYLSQYYNSSVSGFQTTPLTYVLPGTTPPPCPSMTPVTKSTLGEALTPEFIGRYGGMAANGSKPFWIQSSCSGGCLPNGVHVPGSADGKKDPYRCCTGILFKRTDTGKSYCSKSATSMVL